MKHQKDLFFLFPCNHFMVGSIFLLIRRNVMCFLALKNITLLRSYVKVISSIFHLESTNTSES